MIAQWVGAQLLVDRATLAQFLEVSERTVRRHCRPFDYEPAAGRPRGMSGRALYDAAAAAQALADIVPRPRRCKALADLRHHAERNPP